MTASEILFLLGGIGIGVGVAIIVCLLHVRRTFRKMHW